MSRARPAPPAARAPSRGPWTWPALTAALLAAVLLRSLPLLDNRFHPDEALYASFAQLIASGHDPLLSGVVVDKPPLPLYLDALSLLAVGQSEFAARLPNFFASVVSVALLYRLARALYGPGTALLAAWLLALSPFAILFSITLFIDPLLTAVVLWGLWLAVRGRWGWMAVALGVAFAVKQTALFFVPLALALALTRLPASARPGLAARWLARASGLALLGLAASALVVFGWDAARQPPIGFWQQGYGDNIPTRLIRANEVVPRARAWLNLLHYVTASAPLNGLWAAGLAGLLAALRRPASRAALTDAVLAGYLLLYLAAYWLLAFNVWDRYLLPVLPLLLLLLARALQWVAAVVVERFGRARPTRLGLALVLAVLLAPPALAAARSAYPIGGDHGAYDGVDEAARYLRGLPEGTVLYDHWLSWHWRFYLFDGPVYVAWFPSPQALAADLRAFGATSPRYLVVPAWESEAEVRAAAAEAGYTFVERLTTYRRDGVATLVVYELAGDAD